MNLPTKLALLQRVILWSSTPPPSAEGGSIAYIVEAHWSQVTRYAAATVADSPRSTQTERSVRAQTNLDIAVRGIGQESSSD